MDLKNQSIIICSIVRNAEIGLRKNIPILRELCARFGDYKVVIFENDSTDKTKTLLKSWMTVDPARVFAFMTNTDGRPVIPKDKSGSVNPFFGHTRIDRMAQLRNQYLDLVWSRGWEADYLMVVDLDVARIDFSGILTSFRQDLEWDAVTAFGYSLGPSLRRRYHDTYALSMLGDNTPQTEDKIKDLCQQMASLSRGRQWLPVESAFGGLAIYKMKSVRGLHYSVMENNDASVEVRCEHYGLHHQMHERGNGRIFINPEMILKYQSLSWKIVFNSLRRRFDRGRIFR